MIRDLEVEQFREAFRQFLADNAPGRPPRDVSERRAWGTQWAVTLCDAGFAGPAWPPEWGGMGLSLAHQVAYHEEVALARAPGQSPGETIIGPTLMKFGSESQRRRYLPPILRGQELWCLGYSEPEAGSDLASLRTRARLEGDELVVSGQKIWTSNGMSSDFIATLVRTGSEGERQHGISYLLIPLDSAGIRVMPIKDMAGDMHFAEVFFDEVRVPLSNLVGELNGGWTVARTALGFERSTANVARDIGYRRVVSELIDLARRTGQNTSPTIRQKLAQVEIEVRLLHINNVRALSRILHGAEAGPEASITRLMHSAFEQRLHELAIEIIGPYGMLDKSDKRSVQRGRWAWGFLRTRASTIGAGTTEVQRNTVAERVLGLPQEPSTFADSA